MGASVDDKLLSETHERAIDLGRHLQAARLSRGDSQAVLAARAGTSRATVARLESGDIGVSVGHLLSLLSAYGLSAQMVAAVAPERDATAPSLLPRRGRKAKVRDWGEDLF